MIRTLLTILLLAWAGASVAAAEPAGRPGRLPIGVHPVHYEISVEPDAAALTFRGHETVDIVVDSATDAITLNAADLAIESATIDRRLVANVTLDPDAETATLKFGQALSAGPHRLALDYTGRIYIHATGLFAVDYATERGTERVLTTQFEVGDARRFAPMWDEPAAKATFALEAVVPQGLAAFSNMPQASARVQGGKQHIRFATSPKMSSYLLHLTVGDLERISRRVAGVDIGVVTRKGAGETGRFALDSAAEILPWYNEYFGTPYPLPKLDMIAIPGSSAFFGAMENWGAIMYFETALLKDPQVSSESDRQRVFETVAHEMAHQWFGNLVTMDWWTDLWLNEGYATWMETKVAEALHPQWNIRLRVANGPRESALRADAAESTHPVVQPVESVDAANQVFDAIAYSKGAAVIRMLEAGVGEQAFREGIRRYMQRYAYGNAVTDELWTEIAAASGQPVAEIAHDFTLQPGVPLVTLTSSACESGHTQVTLSQGRFETGPQSPVGITWHIPLTVTPVDGGAPVAAQLDRDGAPVTIDLPHCGPFIVNSGQRGYFRTQYSAADFARLRAQVSRIADVDRIGLLNDTFALAQAGQAPATSYLDLAAAVPDDSDPQVIGQLADAYLEIDRLFDGSPQQEAWRVLARNRLAPIFERIGWLASAGEGETVPLLREAMIRALGRFDDATVIAGARQRFAAAAKTPGELPAAIFSPVLTVVAQHADAATWNDIRSRASASTDPLRKQQLYSALGRALDPTLSAKALDLALAVDTPGPVVTRILAAVAVDHPAQAFDFALQREAAVMAHVDTASRWGFIPFLAVWSADPAMAQKVRAYRDSFVPSDARRDADEAIATITDRAAARARQLPALEAWVRDYMAKR